MKTAVNQMIKELQEQFQKEMGDMYERNQLLLEDIALRAKEMDKEQMHAEYMRGWKDGLTKQQEQ
jgi:ribosomal protein S17E